MTKEVYEKAKELMSDVKTIDDQIKETEEQQHWIKVITAHHKECYYSTRFQRELAEWMKTKKEEYQKEFDELQ